MTRSLQHISLQNGQLLQHSVHGLVTVIDTAHLHNYQLKVGYVNSGAYYETYVNIANCALPSDMSCFTYGDPTKPFVHTVSAPIAAHHAYMYIPVMQLPQYVYDIVLIQTPQDIITVEHSYYNAHTDSIELKPVRYVRAKNTRNGHYVAPTPPLNQFIRKTTYHIKYEWMYDGIYGVICVPCTQALDFIPSIPNIDKDDVYKHIQRTANYQQLNTYGCTTQQDGDETMVHTLVSSPQDNLCFTPTDVDIDDIVDNIQTIQIVDVTYHV